MLGDRNRIYIYFYKLKNFFLPYQQGFWSGSGYVAWIRIRFLNFSADLAPLPTIHSKVCRDLNFQVQLSNKDTEGRSLTYTMHSYTFTYIKRQCHDILLFASTIKLVVEVKLFIMSFTLFTEIKSRNNFFCDFCAYFETSTSIGAWKCDFQRFLENTYQPSNQPTSQPTDQLTNGRKWRVIGKLDFKCNSKFCSEVVQHYVVTTAHLNDRFMSIF